jgi:hypothetical protein
MTPNQKPQREEPPSWVVGLEEIEERLGRLRHWEVREICRSPGGRPVWACTFGPEKQVRRTANFSSAYHAGYPQAFWGEDVPNQCYMHVTGVHGAEMEGPAAAVNFMQLMEAGRDLDGKAWPGIVRAAEGMRLVVVPVANPDGRARVEPRSLVGLTLRDLHYWGQGAWKSGELIGYPACKRHQPLPSADVEFMGGYPNDEGYNLMHDVTPGDIRTAEVRALLALAVDEVPDCVLNDHSYELDPGILGSSQVMKGYAERQAALSASVEQALSAHGLRPRAYYESSGYNLLNALHFAAGALTVTYEGPQGIDRNPYTHRSILDCHLAAIEGALKFGAEEGFRPQEP